MATTQTNAPQQPNQQSKSEFGNDASDVKRTLKNEAGAATNAMRDAVTGKASQYASEAKHGIIREAEGAKRQATESLRTFANTIREAGDKLSESDQGLAAGLVRQAASGLERLSSSLSEKRVGEMIDDIRGFGRQNPAAFIAGSVLAGLAIGRFVRSTGSDGGNGAGNGANRRSRSTQPGASSMEPTGALHPMSSPGGAASGSGMASSSGKPSSEEKKGSGTGTAASRPASSSTARPASTGTGGPTGAGSYGSSGIADQSRDVSGGGTGRVK